MKNPGRTKTILATVYGLPFIWVGLQHFINPAAFIPIVPDYLGWPEFWVHITGWTEVALGIGVMIPKLRRKACTLMIIQLCLLYLANLYMWTNDIAFDGFRFGAWGHFFRLLAQCLLIAAAVWLRKSADEQTSALNS